MQPRNIPEATGITTSMIKRFLDPKNDFAFKHIFGNEKHKNLLISFLNTVLQNQLSCPIQDLDFLKTVQDPELASKKQSAVDVVCQDREGAYYIVEMQVASQAGFEARAQYYASKAYISQMNQADQYVVPSNLKAVPGNLHAAFLGEGVVATPPSYPTIR